MIDMGSAASRASSRIAETSGPAPGTKAREWLGDEGTWSSGFILVTGALSAATDHFHAFARLLRKEEPYGPSLAALSRAFCEVAGRAWWLLQSADDAQLEHRAAAMSLRAMREGQGATVRVFSDGRREGIDHAEALREAEQQLSASVVKGRRERVPDYTRLATDVMTAAGVADAVEEYSHLSGVTHGNAIHIGGMGSICSHQADGYATVSLGLPIRNANQYLWTMTHVLDVVMTPLLEITSAPAALDRWTAARERAYNTFEQVFNVLRDAPDPA